MKNKRREVVILCLPLLLVAAGSYVASRVSQSRREQAEYFSQPFVPQVSVARQLVTERNLPGEYTVRPYNARITPGMFAVQARVTSRGGNGKSGWLVHAQLVTAKKPERKVWDKWFTDESYLTDRCELGCGLVSSHFVDLPFEDSKNRPANAHKFIWRFERKPGLGKDLIFVLDAVVVPLRDSAVAGQTTGYSRPRELKAALARPGARKFQVRLRVHARDDAKWQRPQARR